MDVSVLFFAAPFIAADLGATAEQQLWIFDVYGFVPRRPAADDGRWPTGSVTGGCS